MMVLITLCLRDFMSQSKKMSLIESVVNVAVGFGVATAANIMILPLFGYDVSVSDGVCIGLIFTVISIFRSYFIRRMFNHVKSM